MKVLDFGLAKALDTTPQGDPSQSPTLTAATHMGVIMGTAAYMSPEQARGKVVDRRADIWSFGAVLFEMLTGRRAFTGTDVTDTLAAVVRAEPEWHLLPDAMAPSLRVFIQRCLEKDAKDRVGDVHDVRLAMAGAFETAATPVESVLSPQLQVWQRPVVVVGLVAVTGLLTALVASIMMRPEPIPPPDLMQFAIVPDAPLATSAFFQDIAISPDGTQVVYGASSETGPQLYLRRLDQLVGAPLRGTEGGEGPFFSPNGEWVGFTTEIGRMLQKVSISGGLPVMLTELPNPSGVGSWGTDDQIVFWHGWGRVDACLGRRGRA